MKHEDNGLQSLTKQIALLVGQILIATGRPLVVYAAADMIMTSPAGDGITLRELLEELDLRIVEYDAKVKNRDYEERSFTAGYAIGAANALRSIRSFIDG